MSVSHPLSKKVQLLAWATFLITFCPIACCIYTGNEKALEVYAPIVISVIMFLIQQTEKRINVGMFSVLQLAIIAMSCYMITTVTKPFGIDKSVSYNLGRDFSVEHEKYSTLLNYPYIENDSDLVTIQEDIHAAHERIMDSLIDAQRSKIGLWEKDYRNVLEELSSRLWAKYSEELKNNYICIEMNEIVQRRDTGLIRTLFNKHGFTEDTELVSIRENDETGRNHGKLKIFLEGMVIIGTHGNIWKFQRVYEIIRDVQSNKILKIKFKVE